jgi:hypothetical protein
MTKAGVIRAMFRAVNLTPRRADVALLEIATADATTDAAVAEVVGEYVWDHQLGEPKSPTASKLAQTFAAAAVLYRLGVVTWTHDKVYGLVRDPGAPYGYRVVASARSVVALAGKCKPTGADRRRVGGAAPRPGAEELRRCTPANRARLGCR